jgi:hypothetical protein
MRQLSINRRKSGIVDLLISKTQGAYFYQLSWGENFDTDPFTNFLVVPNSGFRDPSVNDASNYTLYGDRVRALFNPVTYGIPDDKIWWLKMSPLDLNGALISMTRGSLMVLTPDIDAGSYFPQMTITGNAPDATDSTGSLEIDFPQQMRDVRIQSAAAMWVAFDTNGPEILLQGADLPKDISRWSTQSSLFVRGDGVAVSFSLVFTLAYTR